MDLARALLNVRLTRDLTAISYNGLSITPHNRVAGVSLDILRGIQGVGAAAMIPASVSSVLGLAIRAISKGE